MKRRLSESVAPPSTTAACSVVWLASPEAGKGMVEAPPARPERPSEHAAERHMIFACGPAPAGRGRAVRTAPGPGRRPAAQRDGGDTG